MERTSRFLSTARQKQCKAINLTVDGNGDAMLDGEPVKVFGLREHPYEHKIYLVVERIRDLALIGLR